MSETPRHEPLPDIDHRILVEALERAGAAIAVLELGSLKFVYANAAFSQFSRGQPIIGRRYSAVFPTAFSLGESVVQDLLAGQGPLRMDDVWVPIPSLQTSDSASFATFEVSTFDVSHHRYLMVTAWETTARVMQEHALEQVRSQESARLALAETLDAINTVIHSSLDYDEIMYRALEAGIAALGAQAGSLFTEVEPNVSEAVYAVGLPPGFVGRRFPAAIFPFTEQMESSRRPIAIGAEDIGTLMNPTLARLFRVRSLLALPVVVRGELIGGIGIIYRKPHEFTDSEIDFAAAFGASLSLSLENANLYRHQQSVASTLQRAQLTIPETMEGVEIAHAYRGATDAVMVGGDFYDIFEPHEGLIGITIGDISGKGLDAAAMTSLVKNSVRAQATAGGQSVAEVVATVNHVLYNASSPESFATLFFATLSRSTHELIYCNAGHTTGALMHSGGAVESLSSTSTIVGALDPVDYGQAVTRIDVGDTLFLYTDGVTEARQHGEFFGEERLFAILRSAAGKAPQRICERVMKAVADYSGGHTTDDIALLVLRRL